MRIVKNGDVHVSAPFWMPKSEVQKFIDEHREWMEKAQKKTSERQQRQNGFFQQLPLQTRAQKDEARQRLKNLIEPMVEHYSAVMDVKPSAITYRAMVSRWGVCNWARRNVGYSTMLAGKDPDLVEYVVVHELTHLRVHGHGPAFWLLMSRRLPDWRSRRARLRSGTSPDGG